jgi:hypothetical protein
MLFARPPRMPMGERGTAFAGLDGFGRHDESKSKEAAVDNRKMNL